jgi:superfamily I DNA and/or RNA helicase
LPATQGREKPVIIFVAVRSSRPGALGFVSDAQRTNVAVTRPQHVLLLVCNKHVFGADELWGKWVNSAQQLDL